MVPGYCQKRWPEAWENAFLSADHRAPLGLALFGAALSDEQVRLIRKCRIKRIVLCFDHDKKRRARENVRYSLAKSRRKLIPYCQVGVLWLPKRGTDPDDYPKKQLFKWGKRALKHGIHKSP